MLIDSSVLCQGRQVNKQLIHFKAHSSVVHPECWWQLPCASSVPHTHPLTLKRLQSRVASSKLSAGPSFQIVQRNYSTNAQLTRVKPIACTFLVTEQYKFPAPTYGLSHNCFIFYISSLPHSCPEGKGPEVSSLTLQDWLQQRLCNSLTKGFKCFVSFFSGCFIWWDSVLWPTQAELTLTSLFWGTLQQQPLWGTSKSLRISHTGT